jgi:hypothetical protein
MKPQPEVSNQEVLAGLVERVTYHGRVFLYSQGHSRHLPAADMSA